MTAIPCHSLPDPCLSFTIQCTRLDISYTYICSQIGETVNLDKQNYIVDNEDGGEDDEEQTGDDILNGLSNENEGEEKLENLKESLNKVEETHPEN